MNALRIGGNKKSHIFLSNANFAYTIKNKAYYAAKFIMTEINKL